MKENLNAIRNILIAARINAKEKTRQLINDAIDGLDDVIPKAPQTIEFSPTEKPLPLNSRVAGVLSLIAASIGERGSMEGDPVRFQGYKAAQRAFHLTSDLLLANPHPDIQRIERDHAALETLRQHTAEGFMEDMPASDFTLDCIGTRKDGTTALAKDFSDETHYRWWIGMPPPPEVSIPYTDPADAILALCKKG